MRKPCAVVVAFALSQSAYATPAETIGLSARSIGMGGGGVSWIDDTTASYLNPAGLSHLNRSEGQIGFFGGPETFQALPEVWWDTNRDGAVDERDAPLRVSSNTEDVMGFTARWDETSVENLASASTYVPAKRLIRFMTFEPSLPTYFMHYNRPQRLMLSLGIGGTVTPGGHIEAASKWYLALSQIWSLPLTAD